MAAIPITVVQSKLSSLSVVCLCYILTNCVHPVFVCERGKLDLLMKFADFENGYVSKNGIIPVLGHLSIQNNTYKVPKIYCLN